MDSKKEHKISDYLREMMFNEEVYEVINSYINDPADNAQTSINARKKKILTLAKECCRSKFRLEDPNFKLDMYPEEIKAFEKIKALLIITGGNRHTKHTKRTTNRKMRKSLIRRR